MPLVPVESSRSLPRWTPAVALAAVCGLLLPKLSEFGIWDPWELEVADLGRNIAEGKDVLVQSIGPWLVGQGFRRLGVDEWTGRLPIALCGLLMVALCYALVAHFAGRRAGVYAVIIAGSSPLFIFNARMMLGEAPAFAAQTAIALAASVAVFGRDQKRPTQLLWLGATLLFSGIGVLTHGALLCVLPPVVAVGALAVFEGKLGRRDTDALNRLSALVVCAMSLGLVMMIARDVLADGAEFSIWLGGKPVGGQPPTFDNVIDRVFHAFAPWSALLPMSLAGLVWMDAEDDDSNIDERRLRRVLVLWLALSFASLTLFLSRYGQKAAVMPVTAISAAVALFLCDVERSKRSQWPAAIAALLLAGLLLRDFALYPSTPVEGLPLADFALPDVFNPKGSWSAVIGIFGGIAFVSLGAYADPPPPLGLRTPYRFLATQWRRGIGWRLWLLSLGLLLIGTIAFGLVCFLAPGSLHLSSLGTKWGQRVLLVPVAVPVIVAALQFVVFLSTRLQRWRSVSVLIAGLSVGAYAAHGFMPALNAHFSPREVYDTYNDLAVRGESLIEYKVESRAAAYYAKGRAIEVDSLSKCVDELDNKERRWAILPSDELAMVDRIFRARTNRHLFVADARSARLVLVTNRAIAGRADQSFLSKFVKTDVPKIQHKVEANFEDKILLLGYDLKLPHGDYVGAGESFELTMYWKALRSVPGNFRIFLHIDASELRIHGDHDPVDGKYPVRLWNAGDIIVDRQKLDVPPNYDSGPYTIFVGFYSGETRLTIKSGPKDDANRANAGVLRIR